MSKKKKNTILQSMDDVFSEIQQSLSDSSDDYYLPNIIDFVYEDKYLGLKRFGINLYTVQKIILKCFYRGWPGNEDLELTSKEIEKLEELKLTEVLEKYRSGALLRELVLVCGRRSGKDFLVGLMAPYEAMRLLEVPGGDPYDYYGLARANPIYILTVANSSDQAHVLFYEMKERISNSPYFINKIGNTDSDRIYLLTPHDKSNNKHFDEIGRPDLKTKGSVVVMSGHSNSDSLLGKQVYALLLDEVASFPVSGVISGDKIYQKLMPATMNFRVQTGEDEYGKPIKRLDSKVITISSPRGEQGVLYKLFRDSHKAPRRLTYKLPTWEVNENLTEDMLREENPLMSPVEFAMEFGAQFAGSGGEKFVSDKLIDDAVDLASQLGLKHRLNGLPGKVYYAHLDPASSSHNYALAIVHAESVTRSTETSPGKFKKEQIKLFIVDHVKIWKGGLDGDINVLEIDEYILKMARLFNLGLVSYDNWDSTHSIQKLRQNGIPSKRTPYNRRYKQYIYDNLQQLLINKSIAIPSDNKDLEYLSLELKCLKKIFTPSGFKIKADTDAVVKTDDMADALAGACATAREVLHQGLPKGRTVHMPISGLNTGTNRPFNIGRGQYTLQEARNLGNKIGILGL